MRKTCLDCTRKHLAQASILMVEAALGYPTHRWLAMGHLAEAETECVSEYPELALLIREQRKAYELDPQYIVYCDALIEEVCRVRGDRMRSSDGEVLLRTSLGADPEGATPGVS